MIADRGQRTRVLVLAGVLFFAALITSRAVLLIHEFAGHAGAALLVGADVTDHRLFLFGGGWVRYAVAGSFSTGEEVFVSLAGVGLELVVGVIALAWSRCRAPGSASRIAGIAVAGIVLVHVGFYLATGTHHGFGDGRVLHRILGPARAPAIALFGSFAVGAGLWLGVALGRNAGESLGTRTRLGRVAAISAAALLATAAHAGLTLGERAVVADSTYAEIMRSESHRSARADVSFEAARRRAEGRPMSEDEAIRRMRDLESERRRFPLRPPLALLIAAAILVGLFRCGDCGIGREPTHMSLFGLGGAAAIAVGAVAMLSHPWWR